MNRRGGFRYILILTLFMGMMIASSMMLFLWLNTWMNSGDNSNSYYYEVYLAFLAANSASVGLHCLMEYNSDFFN